MLEHSVLDHSLKRPDLMINPLTRAAVPSPTSPLVLMQWTKFAAHHKASVAVSTCLIIVQFRALKCFFHCTNLARRCLISYTIRTTVWDTTVDTREMARQQRLRDLTINALRCHSRRSSREWLTCAIEIIV